MTITQARMREAILERGIADYPVAKGVSYRDAFKRLYGVTL